VDENFWLFVSHTMRILTGLRASSCLPVDGMIRDIVGRQIAEYIESAAGSICT
jgi:hypothetical protein